jgi:sulfonate transport system permease protein
MTVVNAVPRIILAPLFVIWFGIGIASKIALTFVLIAVLFFFTVYSGIKEVDQRLVDRVRTLGGGRAVLLREVYVPAVTAWALSPSRPSGVAGRPRSTDEDHDSAASSGIDSASVRP